jgi:hypothetical protein
MSDGKGEINPNKGELNLTWVTSPPIIVLERYEVKGRIEQLKTNMADWTTVIPPKNPVESDYDTNDWQSPKRAQQARWNNRIGNTNTMLNSTSFYSGDRVVEYRVTGEPVGIMTVAFEKANPLYIEALVCHPGAADAGGILVEYAINLAVEKHGKPCVKLSALYEDAKQAYLKLGFRSVSTIGDTMLLDAADSNGIWTHTSGGWRLAKYAVWGKFVS